MLILIYMIIYQKIKPLKNSSYVDWTDYETPFVPIQEDVDIDFEKTCFYLYDILEDSKTPINISDAKDLNKKSMDYNPIIIIKTDKLVLKNKSIENFDLFFMSIGSINIRVSEKIKTELEKK